MLNLIQTLGTWRASYVAARARDEALSRRFEIETGTSFDRIDYLVRSEMLSDAAAEGVEAAMDRYLTVERQALAETSDRDAAVERVIRTYQSRAAL